MRTTSVAPRDAWTPGGIVRTRGDRLMHASMIVAGAGLLVGALVFLSQADAALTVAATPVARVPLVVLILIAVPATVWLCRRPLQLAGRGSAVAVAPDSAVLAFLLWAGAGAAAVVPGHGGRWSQDPSTLLALCVWVWLAWLSGVLWCEVRARERRARNRAFNVALSAIAGAVFLAAAVAVRRVTASALGMDVLTASVGPWDAAAVLAAAGAYVAVDVLVTAIAVSLEGHGRIRDALTDESAVVAAAAVVALAALAVLGAWLLVTEPWALALLAPLTVAVTHAAGVGARASAERARSAALYGAAEECQRAETDDAVLAGLVAGATLITSAPAVLSSRAAGTHQIGAPLPGPDGDRWLVCGAEGMGHSFFPADERALTTLARLGTESLARVAGVAAIRELATRDSLTGSANRATLTAALNQELATAQGPTALLFGDLDGFKAVNDQHGHLCGDQLLIAVARRLAASVRPQDLVARLGGDEFAVLLPATDGATAATLAERLMVGVSTPVSIDGHTIDVHISLGSAATDELPSPDGPSSPTLDDRLVAAADEAMYRVKRAARPTPRRGVNA